MSNSNQEKALPPTSKKSIEISLEKENETITRFLNLDEDNLMVGSKLLSLAFGIEVRALSYIDSHCKVRL